MQSSQTYLIDGICYNDYLAPFFSLQIVSCVILVFVFHPWKQKKIITSSIVCSCDIQTKTYIRNNFRSCSLMARWPQGMALCLYIKFYGVRKPRIPRGSGHWWLKIRHSKSKQDPVKTMQCDTMNRWSGCMLTKQINGLGCACTAWATPSQPHYSSSPPILWGQRSCTINALLVYSGAGAMPNVAIKYLIVYHY